MQRKIAVIGSSNIDFIMKMPRLPLVGETVTDAVYMQTFGGKGANQAVGAARAGGSVFFVSCVGDDDITPRMLEEYRKEGINTEFVFRETNISSGTALVMIGAQGANYLSVSPGANYRLAPHHIDRAADLIREAEIVVLQYEILPGTLKYVLDMCATHGKRVLWNCAPAREFPREFLKNVSILTVNETEAESLAGVGIHDDDSVIQAAKALGRFGCETVIITLGARGSFVRSPEGEEWVPGFTVEAVDTTGAGDIYCGSLAVALVEGKPIREAVKFASAAAAISVTRLGAQPSAPARAEIDRFLAQH